MPRFLGSFDNESGIEKQELLVFCDSSKEAHAYAAYLRTRYNDGEVACNLLGSNYHVSPMKATTMPRLELMGLDLGLESIKIFNQVLKIAEADVHFFVDSLTVLQWFRRESRSLKVFVSNRVARAQRKILLQNLHYVPSAENPSDIPTRGMVPEKLKESDLWFHGPKFAQAAGDMIIPELPQLNKEQETQLDEDVRQEMKTLEALFAQATPEGRVVFEETVDAVQEEEHDLGAHSAEDWNELLEQFLQRRDREKQTAIGSDPQEKTAFSSKGHRKSPRSTSGPRWAPADYQEATFHFVRRIQNESYKRTHWDLKKFGKATNESRIASMSPFVDENGIIRCNSRIRYGENLNFGQKYPIILPAKHSLTKMLTKHIHEKLARHVGGIGLTLSILGKSYLVPKGRNLVYHQIRQCQVCQQANARPSKQKIGPLPPERIGQRLAPFQDVCIDFTGHFDCVQGRGTVKKYAMLIACMATRGIHLEAVDDMTTDKLALAFEAFLARKPRPTSIYCDNGTNFSKCSKELRQFWELMRDVSKRYKAIKWTFMAPHSPHQGGVHERLIGLTKRNLKKDRAQVQDDPPRVQPVLSHSGGLAKQQTHRVHSPQGE